MTGSGYGCGCRRRGGHMLLPAYLALGRAPCLRQLPLQLQCGCCSLGGVHRGQIEVRQAPQLQPPSSRQAMQPVC
eukprot:1145207-Pelagomonas_calceolata.AAC.5